jgi:hypothetical protein
MAHLHLHPTTGGMVRCHSLFIGFTLVLMLLCGMAVPVSALALQYSPTSFSFASTQGGANPASQSLTFWKTGSREKSWTASSTVPWLSTTPGSGSISTERDQIQVVVNTAGLAAGSYSSSVMITTTGVNGAIRKTAVPVTLTVNPAPPVIGLTPASLSFTATAGGTNPAAKTIAVSNTGGGTLSWSAADNAPWLSLTPTSGTNTGSIAASVNVGGLAAGTYTAAVTISAAGTASKTVPVTLTVSPPVSTTIFTISPPSMTYSGTVNGPNQVASVTVTNTSSAPLTVTWYDNINWLIATSGDTVSMPPGGSAVITHTASTAGLAAGTYTGTATITGGGITKQVPISMTVAVPV